MSERAFRANGQRRGAARHALGIEALVAGIPTDYSYDHTFASYDHTFAAASGCNAI